MDTERSLHLWTQRYLYNTRGRKKLVETKTTHHERSGPRPLTTDARRPRFDALTDRPSTQKARKLWPKEALTRPMPSKTLRDRGLTP